MVEHKSSSKVPIPSINERSKSRIKKVRQEIKVYSEEYHLNRQGIKPIVVARYQQLKDEVFAMGDDVEVKPTKTYIAFKRRRRNFLDIEVCKDYLNLYINLRKGALNDPAAITRDMYGKGHQGNGDYKVIFNEKIDFHYLMFLIKQSYDKKE